MCAFFGMLAVQGSDPGDIAAELLCLQASRSGRAVERLRILGSYSAPCYHTAPC